MIKSALHYWVDCDRCKVSLTAYDDESLQAAAELAIERAKVNYWLVLPNRHWCPDCAETDLLAVQEEGKEWWAEFSPKDLEDVFKHYEPNLYPPFTYDNAFNLADNLRALLWCLRDEDA